MSEYCDGGFFGSQTTVNESCPKSAVRIAAQRAGEKPRKSSAVKLVGPIAESADAFFGLPAVATQRSEGANASRRTPALSRLTNTCGGAGAVAAVRSTQIRA